MTEEDTEYILTDSEFNDLIKDSDSKEFDEIRKVKYRFYGDTVVYILMIIAAIILVIVSFVFDFF